jgi:hypothetical protein
LTGKRKESEEEQSNCTIQVHGISVSPLIAMDFGATKLTIK